MLVSFKMEQNHFVMKTSHANSTLSIFSSASQLSGISSLKGRDFILLLAEMYAFFSSGNKPNFSDYTG